MRPMSSISKVLRGTFLAAVGLGVAWLALADPPATAPPADPQPANREPLDRPIESSPEPPAPPPEPDVPFATPVDPPLGFAGPSSVAPSEVQDSGHFVPVEDRWRIGFPDWTRSETK